MQSIAASMRQVFRSRNLAVITLTQSLFMVTATLWWPYWSLFILELGATPTLLGLIFMTEMTVMLLFQFLGGLLTDRLGRKRIIVVGSILRAISPIIYIFSGSWVGILMGMMFTQAANMMVPAIDALIAESIAVENRAVGFGAFRMMTWMPMTFTAFVGGIIVDWLGVVPGVKFCIALTLVVAWFNVVIRWKFLRETYVMGRNTEHRAEKSIASLKGIKAVPRSIWVLIVVASFSSFAFRVSGSFMVVYATQELSLTNTQWGLITTLVSVVSTALTIPGSILSDRIGRKPGITLGLILNPAQMIGFTFAGDFLGVMACRILGGISEGFGGNVYGLEGGSAWLALVADVVPSSSRGSVMGLIATLAGLFSLPGTFVGGFMYDHVSILMPFQTAFISGLAAAAMFILFVREPVKKAE